MTRAEKHARIVVLIGEGLTHRQVAARVGMTRSGVRNLLFDPDGSKQRERRKRYQGACVVCGAATDGSNGRAAAPRYCAAHIAANPEWIAAITKWPERRIVAAIQAWAAEHGEPPAQPDWNPTQCRIIGDLPRARRAAVAIRAGRAPWFTVVVNHFGSWNAGIAAAGFTPRVSGGGGGNITRRRDQRAKRERQAA